VSARRLTPGQRALLDDLKVHGRLSYHRGLYRRDVGQLDGYRRTTAEALVREGLARWQTVEPRRPSDLISAGRADA